MTIEFRPTLSALQPYPPGKPTEEVQREFGLTSIVKLASNENPYGPSPKALAAIKEELGNLHLYPESGCHYLREKLAGKLNVAPHTLLFGNGSDEIVAIMALTFLEPHHNIVCSEQTFIRYEMGATTMGAATKKVAMKDWRHDVDALAAAVDPNTRLLFIANPDNPVGSAVTATEIDRLLAAVPPEVIVVLDEAYYEYATSWEDYPDSISLLPRHPNLVILRTFSKAYGLAGIRLGYGIANPEVWNAVERVRPPFNVNRLAQVAAVAALDDTEHLRATIEGNAAGRKDVAAAFDKLGISHVPSLANFILADLKRPALPVYESLMRRGVIVRPMSIYNLPEHLRVSIGLPAENQIFVEALTAVLNHTEN